MKTFYQTERFYDLESAKEILIPLLEREIQHHSIENFSSEIRFGKINEQSIKRKQELENILSDIKNILKEANNEQKELKVSTLLKISTK